MEVSDCPTDLLLVWIISLNLREYGTRIRYTVPKVSHLFNICNYVRIMFQIKYTDCLFSVFLMSWILTNAIWVYQKSVVPVVKGLCAYLCSSGTFCAYHIWDVIKKREKIERMQNKCNKTTNEILQVVLECYR